MPEKKSPDSVRIRNSTAEFLTFAYQTGGDGVAVRVQGGTIWLETFERLLEEILRRVGSDKAGRWEVIGGRNG